MGSVNQSFWVVNINPFLFPIIMSSAESILGVGFESSGYTWGVFNSMIISQDPRYLVSK